MKSTDIHTEQPNIINLAITPYKLKSLIQEGKLNPTDFHCLDPQSKKSVWGMIRSLTAFNLG